MISSERSKRFQSTLPVRGATRGGLFLLCGRRHFNPRSPCGERPANLVLRVPDRISIHAPRAGSDPTLPVFIVFSIYFNPRSPCGERPQPFKGGFGDLFHFNPRSPCGERLLLLIFLFDNGHFNPRSPCGERPSGLDRAAARGLLFQSTLPVRGATGVRAVVV